MVITNLTLTINFYRQLVLLHEKAEQFEEASIKAQYVALQNQLNPHFLFNSLNTLISEIEYSPRNAVLFTQRLSDVYRYILQSQQQRLVTLKSELSFIDSYIFLHKVRLGDCIRIDNKVELHNYDLKLPSLALQLLVENVIKHNIINMDYPMKILIDYEQQSGMLAVTNEIRVKPNVATTGMGLKNLSIRYRLICDKNILIESNTNYFTVKVPLLNE
ncbi:histidine kinase [Bacteroides fragilis]|nr:histidine kinase [Bacteroides fragilis]